MRPTTSLTLFLAFVLTLVFPIAAQDVKVSVASAKVEGAEVVVTLSVESGWHVYAANVGEKETRTRFSLLEGPATFQGEVKEPKPKHKRQTFEGSDYVQEYDYHEGSVAFRVPFVAKGAGKVKARVDFVACNDESCLPPANLEWSFDVAATSSVQAPTAPPKPFSIADPESSTSRRADDPVKIPSLSYSKVGTVGVPSIVEIEVTVDDGWHIYALDPKTEVATPTRFDLVETPGKGVPNAKVDKDRIVSIPLPEDHKGDQPYSGHSGSVTFKVPVIPSASGKQAWRFRMRYQACDEKSCLPPVSFTYDMEVDVEAAAGSIPTTTKPQPAQPQPVTTTPTNPPTDSRPVAHARWPEDGTGVASITGDSVEPNATAQLTIKFPGGLPMGDYTVVMESALLTVVGKPMATRLANGDGQIVATIKVSPDARDGDISLNGQFTIGPARTNFEGKSKIVSTLLGFIILAIGSAGFALLTPCVFPMIPVTISYFTKRSGGKPIRLGLLYCFGIVASFTLIGVIFTMALGGEGATVFAQHWITNAAIGILFIVFAASLFGGFEIQLPTFVTNFAGSAQSQGGVVGILLMGALFSVTTFTCTAAFIGNLLAQAATTGSWLRPLIGMVVFSSVLAAPFFFLSAFPSLVKSLPRSGGWMNEVKVVMGFVEVAFATKFLSAGFPDYFPRTVCLIICVAAFVAMGLYMLGSYRLPHDSDRGRTPVTALFLAMGAFGFAIYLGSGVNGSQLNPLIDGFLPAVEHGKDPEGHRRELVDAIRKSLGSNGGAVGATDAHKRLGIESRFVDGYDSALVEAKRLGVPLFIDFTGFTCQNCRTVEAVVFRNKEVRAILDKMVVVELHCDHPDEALGKKNLALEEKFVKAITQPYYVVIDPNDERQYGAWAFDLNIDNWKSKLEDALSRHAARTR